ncbi:hypothetical protein JQ633_06585 [Bradyrhizobium tropiciagri]|uniref:hypothetical protein n=1 Tax=Bradyrhizobium tropiciagri TaxID=312253 RepID=UPI001BA57492|nr:hypothetical protein [Bradyrhizobium tropiciagri]MBR0870017.1 hypothetical protein [Bradyrhizobium tropiciagri]
MTRTKWLNIAVAFALISRPTMAAVNDEQDDRFSVRPFTYVPSLDTAPVDIQIRGTRWRVPRNFLETATLVRSEAPGWSAALRIVTTLSTLTGATPKTLRCFKSLSAEICPDGIVMLVHRPSVSAERWNRPALIEAASDPRDDLFGLTNVKAQVSLGRQDVYVFFGGSFEKSPVIACRPVGGMELLQDCSVRLEIGGVPLRYSFARSQLPYWRRIHDGVVSIVRSFETKDGR